MMLVDQLKKLIEDQPSSIRPVQLLLCGDFNSLPDSGVIEYIQNGKIPTGNYLHLLEQWFLNFFAKV